LVIGNTGLKPFSHIKQKPSDTSEGQNFCSLVSQTSLVAGEGEIEAKVICYCERGQKPAYIQDSANTTERTAVTSERQ
jgi:hypothetical protein